MVDEMRLKGTLTLRPSVVTANLSSQLGTKGTLTGVGGLRGEDLRFPNTVDYEGLKNKPSINGNTLTGDMTGPELGLQNKLIPGNGIDITEDVISIKYLIFDCGTSTINVEV